jgi:peptide/nickel transport system permease protein
LSTALDHGLPAEVAAQAAPVAATRPGALRRASRHPGVVMGAAILLLLIALALAAPLLGTVDPAQLDPSWRNKPPGTEHVLQLPGGGERQFVHRMGTDSLGRDVYSRVLLGARVSLTVGLAVAAIAVLVGLAIGLAAGYMRWLDAVIMRVMDGLMAIPGILLALALVALWGAGLGTVIAAIAVPEIPRVVRLVRSVVLSVREEPYVEAAIAVGTRTPLVLWRHVLPNTIAPLIVQGTYVCASAILVEAILSFLGVGIPTDIPTWGNIMAEGRTLFRVYPHTILYPGVFLAFTVLAVNMLGDGLGDTLDPRLAKRF